MSANETYWKRDAAPDYPPLAEDIRCSCLVIGGGLCGVLTAYLLGKRGIDTVLIEKERLGCGKTAGTTAKATLCHGTLLSRIWKSHGREGAMHYTEANRHGLRLLRELLPDGGEETAQTADFFLYSNHGERRIAEEYRCLRECGVDCTMFRGQAEDFELPRPPKSGIRLREQLHLHPLLAIRTVARRTSAAMYEMTEGVSAAKTKEGHIVRTAKGHIIRAKTVVITANYPVLVPQNLNFLKLYRETTYAAAFSGTPALGNMYYGIDGGHAYRSHGDTLIVSGERYRTASPENAPDRLVDEAKRLFPRAEVTAQWSNNDCYTHDGIPYVGKAGDGILLAAGFNGWGMTNAASAALMLSYLAAGEVPLHAALFSPKRNLLKGGGSSLLRHAEISAAGMMQNLTVPDKTAAELRPGCAAIVSHNGQRAGAYRDDSGKLHLVKVKCPHLHCSLEWNPAAKTWDCPCHGSRFSPDGVCISEPAHESICITGFSAE